MSTLAEIEAAASTLPPKQKQELLLSLVKWLRAEGTPLPETRQIPRAQIEQWIAVDEADMERFRK